MTEPRRVWKSVADQFLEYFHARDHTVVPSSSLIPAGDPTLLFVNAGMVQFKDVFLGREQRGYRRAATLQKCMRVQGKHNDLDNVGPSPRHHTFFLMLGNFSFGDYFKREAVAFAWELMTRSYGIDADRLIMTVHRSDEEAAAAWRGVSVPPDRILRMGDATNFWMMADVGPCGPTSEIHYDWGPQACTCGRSDCSVALDNGCLRWLEVWNLVFMQFDQQPDGTRVPLPRPGVDTGMGLERITSVLQGVNDDYRTDLFTPLMGRIQRALGHSDRDREQHSIAYRVMADHGRATVFLIADGIMPGNEGRSYVLRMIMRRAMRFGRAAGIQKAFLADVAGAVVDEMGGIYPDLQRQRASIQTAARQEEDRFTQTLSSGLQRLEELIAAALDRSERVLPGPEVFRLYDTYGFPVEMTRDVAREQGLSLDEAGFARAMEAQRERARAARSFVLNAEAGTYSIAGQPAGLTKGPSLVAEGLTTEFVGYAKQTIRAHVTALLVGGERAERADAGDEVEVILDRTPFYPEGGGQVGDTGTLKASSGTVEVRDTKRAPGGLILHLGVVREGSVRVGQPVRAAIDAARRLDIMRNHTATHLLHQALREILGEHARQSGSLVAPDRLRFDFVHLAPLASEQRLAIEARVNEQVLADLRVRAQWMGYDEAVRLGAMALFGEKYGDRVRVISIGGYSRELCGGTHLTHTSQIGVFKITAEGSVAAGVRRIEAVTGRGAYELVVKQDAVVNALSQELSVEPEGLPDRVKRLQDRIRELERELRTKAASQPAEPDYRLALSDGTVVVAKAVESSDPGQLRSYADRLGQSAGARVIAVVGSLTTGQIVVTTSDPSTHAGKFVDALTKRYGGGGGGRDKMGQGGVKDPAVVSTLLAAVVDASVLDELLKATRRGS